MSQLLRKSQGGSVLIFAIVTTALLLSVAGGITIARNYTSYANQVASNNPTPTTSSPDTNSNNTNNDPNDQPANETPNDNKSNQAINPPANTDNSDSNNTNNSPTGTDESNSNNQAQTNNTELPVTGPSEVFFTSIMLASIVALSISYLISRKALLSPF